MKLLIVPSKKVVREVRRVAGFFWVELGDVKWVE
jgi:hypothetical protein